MAAWAKLSAAWSSGAVLFFSCAAWAAVGLVVYCFVFARLITEFKRQEQGQTQASDASAQVDPVWRDAASQDGIELATKSRHAPAGPAQVERNNSFFPPFRPTSTFQDPAQIMFARVKHNLLTSGTLAIANFAVIFIVSYEDKSREHRRF